MAYMHSLWKHDTSGASTVVYRTKTKVVICFGCWRFLVLMIPRRVPKDLQWHARQCDLLFTMFSEKKRYACVKFYGCRQILVCFIVWWVLVGVQHLCVVYSRLACVSFFVLMDYMTHSIRSWASTLNYYYNSYIKKQNVSAYLMWVFGVKAFSNEGGVGV